MYHKQGTPAHHIGSHHQEGRRVTQIALNYHPNQVEELSTEIEEEVVDVPVSSQEDFE